MLGIASLGQEYPHETVPKLTCDLPPTDNLLTVQMSPLADRILVKPIEEDAVRFLMRSRGSHAATANGVAVLSLSARENADSTYQRVPQGMRKLLGWMDCLVGSPGRHNRGTAPPRFS